VAQLVKKFPTFYKIGNFVTYSQQPASGPDPEPHELSRQFSTVSLISIFILFFHLTFVFQVFSPLKFLGVKFCMHFWSTPCVIYPANHFIWSP